MSEGKVEAGTQGADRTLSAIEAFFEGAADEKYRAFQASLKFSSRPVPAVRMPRLREKARAIITSRETRRVLDAILALWKSENRPRNRSRVLACEWTLLGSVLIGRDASLTPGERAAYYKAWCELLDGWGLVDCHAAEGRFMRVAPDFWQPQIEAWIDGVDATRPETVWTARLGIAAILYHFNDAANLDWAYKALSSPRLAAALKTLADQNVGKGEGATSADDHRYYLTMALGWCWATLFCTDADRTTAAFCALMKAGLADAGVAKKFVRKVGESLKTSDAEYEMLKEVLKSVLKEAQSGVFP